MWVIWMELGGVNPNVRRREERRKWVERMSDVLPHTEGDTPKAVCNG